MQGDAQVIASLNGMLAYELAAIDQYFVQAHMFDNWGLGKLHEHLAHEMEHEQQHAKQLIDRILFLGGAPDMVARAPLSIGNDVEQMLRNDLQMEMQVVDGLKQAIAVCEQAGDYQSRELLECLLKDTEEDHVLWLEQQLGLIGKLGLQNYLQSQT